MFSAVLVPVNELAFRLRIVIETSLEWLVVESVRLRPGDRSLRSSSLAGVRLLLLRLLLSVQRQWQAKQDHQEDSCE
jgi:hypothetical protein